MGLKETLRRNHGLVMVLGCAIPLVLVLVAVFGFGVSGGYLGWLVLLCPLAHVFMMAGGHNDHGGKDHDEKNHDGKRGSGRSCH